MSEQYSRATKALISDISKSKRLSKAEESALILEYQQTKDPATASRIVRSNVKHLVFYIQRYMRGKMKMRISLSHPLFLDLFQEASLAFLGALATCDPEKGCIRTYAGLPIREALSSFMARNSPILRTPRQKRIPAGSMASEMTDPEDTAKQVSATDILSSHQPDQEHLVVSKHGADTVFNMKTLSSRERLILKQYYQNNKTFKQLGKELKICASWVRQIKLRAEKKAREQLDVRSSRSSSPNGNSVST